MKTKRDPSLCAATVQGHHDVLPRQCRNRHQAGSKFCRTHEPQHVPAEAGRTPEDSFTKNELPRRTR